MNAQCVFCEQCFDNSDCPLGECCASSQCTGCPACVDSAQTPVSMGDSSNVAVQLFGLNSNGYPPQIYTDNDFCDNGIQAIALERQGTSNLYRGICGPYDSAGGKNIGTVDGFVVEEADPDVSCPGIPIQVVDDRQCLVSAQSPIAIGEESQVTVRLLNFLEPVPVWIPNVSCGRTPNQRVNLCRVPGTDLYQSGIDPDNGCDANCGSYSNAGQYYIGSQNGFDVTNSGTTIHCEPFVLQVGGPICGNSIIEAEEQCDAGQNNNTNGDCTTQCRNAFCGDGLVWNQQSGQEQCDGSGQAQCQTGEACVSCECVLETPDSGREELLVVSIIPTPLSHAAGSSLEKIVVEVLNRGELPCDNGELQLLFLNVDGSTALNSLERDITVLAGESVLVEFSNSNPPAPDSSSLPEGTYRIQARLFCPATVFQSQRAVFFSVGIGGEQAIPEIHPAFLALLPIALIWMLFKK